MTNPPDCKLTQLSDLSNYFGKEIPTWLSKDGYSNFQKEICKRKFEIFVDIYLLKLIVWKVQRFLTHAAIQAMLWSRYIWKEIIKKKMKTQSWIILGRVFNNFKMMWIERVIRFKKFSCLQSYSDRHNIFHFQTTIWLTEKLLLVEHVMVLMKEHRSLDTARENFWVDYSNNYSKFILLKAICIIPQE